MFEILGVDVQTVRDLIEFSNVFAVAKSNVLLPKIMKQSRQKDWPSHRFVWYSTMGFRLFVWIVGFYRQYRQYQYRQQYKDPYEGREHIKNRHIDYRQLARGFWGVLGKEVWPYFRVLCVVFGPTFLPLVSKKTSLSKGSVLQTNSSLLYYPSCCYFYRIKFFVGDAM